jgi:hypothetical protein
MSAAIVLWKAAGMNLHETTEARELAYREADGVEVTLLWHPVGDFVTVTVVDSRGGDRFELVLEDGDRALDVFNHPYAHCATWPRRRRRCVPARPRPHSLTRLPVRSRV